MSVALMDCRAGMAETCHKDGSCVSREEELLRELLCVPVWPREFGRIGSCPCGFSSFNSSSRSPRRCISLSIVPFGSARRNV
jgi:hypothetical protein